MEKLEFHFDTDANAFDDFVINSDQNSLYQCSNWIKVKTNWEGHMTSLTNKEGKIVGSGLVLIRKVPLGKTLFYLPRGPILDYSNKEVVAFYFSELKKIAKKYRAIAIRFDPLLYSRKYLYTDKDNDIPYENKDVIAMLESLGCKHKGYTKMIQEATQPRYNASMVVEEGWKDLLVKNTRQSVRTAIKRGVEVRIGKEYLKEFAEAMHATETRQGVALRDYDYFKNMVEAYGDECIVAVAILNFKHQQERLEMELNEALKAKEHADSKKELNRINQRIKNAQNELERNEKSYKEEGKEEVVLCGKLVCFNKKRMEFFYMGNNTKYMRVRANYYLYYKFLEKCQEMGISYCSFGGVEGSLDDGLTQYKSAWPIHIEEYIGEFNMILDPIMYWGMDSVYPKMLERAAKKKSKQ